MHEENSLELGGTTLRTVAPAILGQRFLEAAGKAQAGAFTGQDRRMPHRP